MDVERDKINEVKTIIITVVAIIVTSAIGFSVISFEILLFGVITVSLIGSIGIILYFIKKSVSAEY